MARLDFDSTMSMLESMVRKNGHRSTIACSRFMPSLGCSARYAFTAAPKPYQPGSISRHCAQENTQGIARKSEIAMDFLREAGREPMLSVATSVMTVEAWK